MKKFLLAIAFALSLAPTPALAALDCAQYPEDTQCICFLDTGGQPAGPEDVVDVVTDTAVECQQTCDNVNAVSYQFNECVNGVENPGANTSLSNAAVYSAPPTNSSSGSDLGSSLPEYSPTIPVLNVPLPGLDLSHAIQKTTGGYVTSSLIGLYIQAAYRYLLVAGALMAIVLLMVGGLEYVTSGGSSKRVERAKSRIRNAIIGLILLFAAYDLAFLLNPQTVIFAPLELQYIKGVPIAEQEEDPDILSQYPPDTNVPSDPNITTVSGHTSDHIIAYTSEDRIGKNTLDQLLIAANAYYAQTGKNVWVTSASRDVSLQAKLFFERFLAPGSAHRPSTCDPTGSTYGRSAVVSYANRTFTAKGELQGVTDENTGVSILTQHGEARNCPHTSNIAVDIFPEGSPGNYEAYVKDMVALNQVMVANGFCRLSSEAWHYELLSGPPLSTNHCSTQNTNAIVSGHNPAGCELYNFKDFCCVRDDTSDGSVYPTMCR